MRYFNIVPAEAEVEAEAEAAAAEREVFYEAASLRWGSLKIMKIWWWLAQELATEKTTSPSAQIRSPCPGRPF